MKNKRTCDYIAEAIQNEILSGRMKEQDVAKRRDEERERNNIKTGKKQNRKLEKQKKAMQKRKKRNIKKDGKYGP